MSARVYTDLVIDRHSKFSSLLNPISLIDFVSVCLPNSHSTENNIKHVHFTLHGKNSIVDRTIFWSTEPENIVFRPLLPDGLQNYTSIGVATILLFLNVITMHGMDLSRVIDKAIYCLNIFVFLFIYLHFFTYIWVISFIFRRNIFFCLLTLKITLKAVLNIKYNPCSWNARQSTSFQKSYSTHFVVLFVITI